MSKTTLGRVMNIMKKTCARIIWMAMLTGILSLCWGTMCAMAYPTVNFDSIYTYGDSEIKSTRINVQRINDENVIVLPSTATPENVAVYMDVRAGKDMMLVGAKKATMFTSGMSLDLTLFCEKDDYRLDFVSADAPTTVQYSIRFLFSENIPALYINSDNALIKGRRWVEASPDKSNKATGSMILQKSNGELVYDGVLTQIKGRGNSTWEMKKKPYQIKTETAVDLLETKKTENESKTWVLLANYLDPALLRNSLMLNLGNELGMKMNVENAHIDLYYDGEYCGNYMLTEKVEVGSGRVDVKNLEKENKTVYQGLDPASLPTRTAVTSNGATYTYCDSLISPEDISGGYLIEMDYEVRAKEEICYFRTHRGQYVVVKSPECASKEEMEYIASLYQDYEDAVFNKGINPRTGKSYSDYVDARSIACYYLANEFSKARDLFASSAYLYKQAGDDKMYMGPLWDYDLSLGKGDYEAEGDESAEGMTKYNTEFGKNLLGIKNFSDMVQKIYLEEFYPIIKNIVLNEDATKSDDHVLQSLDYEADLIEASAKINADLWHTDTNWNVEKDNLKDFVEKRAEELKSIFGAHVVGNAYWDVLPSDWFYRDVITATDFGYMTGMGNGFFSPGLGVRRSEIAQVLYNMTVSPEIIFEQLFIDVKKNDWYADAVMWAVGSRLMNAYPDSRFRPEKYITREELATYLYRYENSPEVTTQLLDSFKDGKDVSVDAKNAMEWMLAQQIFSGDANRIYPQKSLTRAELAAVLVRYNRRPN